MTSKRHGRRRRPHAAEHRHAPGTPPGTLRADPAAPSPLIDIIAYGPDAFHERRLAGAAELPAARAEFSSQPVIWVNVAGLGDDLAIEQVGKVFGLHRLALEDVVHAHQRTKLEQYPGHIYMVLRLPERLERLDTEQISMFLGHGFVLTFEERPGGCFDFVRDRIRAGKGSIRQQGADYLAYALLDVGIDSHFPVLEDYGELLQNLEDDIVSNPRPATISAIHAVKRDLIVLRRAIWPLRETLGLLSREASTLVRDETRLYLRDCYDHIVQIIELLESYREIASSLLDVYLSSVNNRMNEIMKLLTIISTIFIPLGFIASVYGMNFNPERSGWNMPELNWSYGYPFALGLMGGVAAALLIFFRRRGWLGGGTALGRLDVDGRQDQGDPRYSR